MRGRSDSLGKDSMNGGNKNQSPRTPLYGNEEDEAYIPKRKDTFHLRRGTLDSDNDDSYGGYNH